MLKSTYVLLLLAVVWIARGRVVRDPRARVGVAWSIGVVVVAAGLALLGSWTTSSTRWGGSMFLVLGLFAWGVFLHLPLTLVLVAQAMRKTSPRAALLAACAAAAIAVVGLWAFVIEPQRLVVTHYQVASERVSRAYRVVLLADIQTDQVGDFERRALELALDQEPDMILFAGDYVHRLESEDYGPTLKELHGLLQDVGLQTPLRSIAVEGNCEREAWPRLFDGLPVKTAVETQTFERAELRVTALSFRDGFDSDLVVPSQPGFHIVLSHAPDFALGQIDADLLLAGHTHGGQVQLPWIGPLLTLSAVPNAWASGRTDLPGGGTLIVSRGIGMERGHAPRLRLFCPPEVVVIDIVPR